MTDVHLQCPVAGDRRCTRGCTEPACKKGAEAHALDCQGKHAEANALRDGWAREPLPFDHHLKVGPFARRIQVPHFTPAERAIYDAVHEVEKVGAHVWLTEAVTLLQKARDRVADYVDSVMAGDRVAAAVADEDVVAVLQATGWRETYAREAVRLGWEPATRIRGILADFHRRPIPHNNGETG